MSGEKPIYHWKKRDKILYFLSLIPFAIAFIGGLVIMYPICIYMSFLWILIYFALIIFQAGCCISCPYRGKYCPAILGIYFSNVLSKFLYSDFEYEENQFKQNAIWSEITIVVFILYPVYWLFISNWFYVLIYFALIFLHFILFMPTQCRRCSFNCLCPGGKIINKIFPSGI